MIARNTAFTFKGKPLDVKTIGRELNVRYVLSRDSRHGQRIGDAERGGRICGKWMAVAWGAG